METKLVEIFRICAPLMAGVAIALLGRFVGFIFSDFFGWRSSLSLLVVFLVALALLTNLAGWITLGAFVIMIGVSITSSFTGPKTASQILFAGFYDTSERRGFLTRTDLSKMLDADFFRVFEKALREHGIQNYDPVSVLSFKPPALIHRWCDRDRFSRIAMRYSQKGLGTVWGTADQNGIKTLDVTLNRELNARNPKAQEQIDRLVRILNWSDILPEQRARYLGTVLAAIWCQSFCNDIAYGGDWQAAQRLATESRRMIESALHEVAASPRQKQALTLLSKCYCQTHAFR